MKTYVRLTALFLCFVMVLSMSVFGYAGNVTQNPAVVMPKGSPLIDGNIETSGVWSDPAQLNDATLGRFWAHNLPTSTANVYFAYNDNGLFFAADIYDHSISNSFVATTGYDNINPSGTSRPYGWNGDVLTLMLDSLGVFEKNTKKQTTPWYNVGISPEGIVKVYRSQVNEKDITASVTANGKITETGWCFELYIPWSVIIADVSALGLSVTQAKLATVGSVSRAACMYMDRYYTANGSVDTWGRFITVCESTYDGYNGCHTNGVSAKAYGIVLNHADVAHIWGDWTTTKEPTCTMMGVRTRYCSHCTQIQTQPIMPVGHSAGEPVITSVTCTEDGYVITYCTNCNAVLSEEIARAQGHVMSDWETVIDATDTENGLKIKSCANCDYTEEEVIPALSVPYVSTKNYTMSVTLADEIKDMRFAPGVYTKPSEIKAAEGNVAIDNATVIKGTSEGIYSYEMPSVGTYTLWIRMKNGSEFILPVEVKDIETYLTAYGVRITVNDFKPDLKDFFIAKGKYNNYSEIKAAGYIVNVTSVKVAGRHDYTYTVHEDGIHTVLVRYNDGSYDALHIDLTVDKPVFTENGLQVIISNLPDVKVIRTAYGTWNTVKELKATDTIRNFSAKTAIKGKDPYTIQYRNEGAVTVIVEYNNGYLQVFHYNVAKKKPVLSKTAGSLTFSGLDGLVNLRYAKGRYTASADIKNAEGSVTLKSADIDTNGNIVIKGLSAGLWSFCVQYDDESYNYYTVTMEDVFADSVEIGSNRQMFWDDYAVNTDGNYQIVNGEYVKKEIVFTFNKAYESGGIVFPNIVEMPDGTYRMYYTGFSNRRRVCYLTSTDGLTWKRANLRSNTYTGESYTNIVTSELVSPSALYVFYDNNPNTSEKIKGIYGQWGDGLFLEHTYNNGDYFDFYPAETKMMGSPSETQGCFFDTLNTVFWDEQRGQYVAFVRGFHEGDNYNLTRDYVEYNPTVLVRDTRVAYSYDCVNWTIPEPIKYNDGVDHQMYANAITQYERSEGLYIGMPTRFILDSNGEKWTDTFFMSSRDLLNWNRSSGPILAPAAGQMYEYPNCGYPAAGMIQTSENEISFYMDEYDAAKKCDVLYRYTVRTDGFMAATGTKLETKPLIKEGNTLELNFKGQVKVTMTDAAGNSVTSGWIQGDEIAKTVTFDGTLASDNVILTFEMKNAKLYSFKFN